ncbi:VWA domain-containing protein [Corallococcus macrosporus]|uniref:von Willebrand factor, type A n=1 Tax=Myxococcus fulvus (strain ATCC BAA-855 / HW-1) TaxID=483219 RepID=F8CL08_MYXFH|nr:VWA domain-containing protein [Corallococcus macrosporus]AEI63921.1 von Willebrand factor, type A [Corallococcus macrosporus]
MSDAFDAGALERGYAFLDDCPAALLQDVITFPVGTLPERVRGIRAWRDALLDGRLPPEGSWPSPELATPARRATELLNLARFCKGQPELVDAFLRDVLTSFSRRAPVIRAEVLARLRELEQLERQRLEAQEAQAAKRDRRARAATQVDEVTLARLRQQAELEVAQRPAEADAGLLATWGERARVWAEISDVFGDLGELLGRGWDLSLGVLKHTGWMDLVRLRELVGQLPQLASVVRALGRLRESDAEQSVAETLFVPMRRLEEERRETWMPHVPAETRGLERSGELARMLPVEVVNLGHPKLRYLWHARRAERALLTYRVEGLELERTLVERDSEQVEEQRRPRPQRGPIIAVVDTSGSMQGLPEQVGKALVLEALRTAHAEKRRCFLYDYSGPGQVREFELSLTAEGLGRLLTFLGQSFGGGSDVAEVTARVVQRLDANDWKRADVLFVSDGEWPVPDGLPRRVEQAREKGTRFHGVQIGNRGRTGLHALCDPVHVFQDWAAVGG